MSSRMRIARYSFRSVSHVVIRGSSSPPERRVYLMLRRTIHERDNMSKRHGTPLEVRRGRSCCGPRTETGAPSVRVRHCSQAFVFMARAYSCSMSQTNGARLEVKARPGQDGQWWTPRHPHLVLGVYMALRLGSNLAECKYFAFARRGSLLRMNTARTSSIAQRNRYRGTASVRSVRKSVPSLRNVSRMSLNGVSPSTKPSSSGDSAV